MKTVPASPLQRELQCAVHEDVERYMAAARKGGRDDPGTRFVVSGALSALCFEIADIIVRSASPSTFETVIAQVEAVVRIEVARQATEREARA